MRNLLLLMAAAALLRCQSADPVDPVAVRNARALVEIAGLERARAQPRPLCDNLRASPSAEVRATLAVALGRITAASGIPCLIALLGDAEPRVRAQAAFALGCFESRPAPGGRRALLLRLASETDPPVRTAILLALGRLGGDPARAAIENALGDRDALLREAAALAAGRLAADYPKGGWKTLGPRVAQALGAEGSAPARRALAFAAARLGARPPDGALRDPDPETRAFAASAWGTSAGDPQTLRALISDADWRVRAAALTALGQLSGASAVVAEALRSSFQTLVHGSEAWLGGAQVVLAAIDALRHRGLPPARRRTLDAEGTTSAREALEEVLRAAGDSRPAPPHLEKALAAIHCASARALDEIEGARKRVDDCGRRLITPWLRTREAARGVAAANYANEADRLQAILPFLRSQDPRVRAAAAAALGPVWSVPGARALVVQTLRTRDPQVLRALGGVIAVHGGRDPELEAGVITALGSVDPLRTPKTATELLRALGAVGSPRSAASLVRALGVPVRAVREAARASYTRLFPAEETPAPVPPKLTGFPSPAPVEASLRFGRVETTRGTFDIVLLAAHAPVAVGNFVALAERRAFRSRRVSAVRPGKEIVFGASGAGVARPGYVLPDELSPVRFVRGSVGLVTGGRDSGGGRFFVALRDLPERDGAMTFIGAVVRGMEIVDALVEGDEILDVRIDDAAPPPTPQRTARR